MEKIPYLWENIPVITIINSNELCTYNKTYGYHREIQVLPSTVYCQLIPFGKNCFDWKSHFKSVECFRNFIYIGLICQELPRGSGDIPTVRKGARS